MSMHAGSITTKGSQPWKVLRLLSSPGTWTPLDIIKHCGTTAPATVIAAVRKGLREAGGERVVISHPMPGCRHREYKAAWTCSLPWWQKRGWKAT